MLHGAGRNGNRHLGGRAADELDGAGEQHVAVVEQLLEPGTLARHERGHLPIAHLDSAILAQHLHQAHVVVPEIAGEVVG